MSLTRTWDDRGNPHVAKPQNDLGVIRTFKRSQVLELNSTLQVSNGKTERTSIFRSASVTVCSWKFRRLKERELERHEYPLDLI